VLQKISDSHPTTPPVVFGTQTYSTLQRHITALESLLVSCENNDFKNTEFVVEKLIRHWKEQTEEGYSSLKTSLDTTTEQLISAVTAAQAESDSVKFIKALLINDISRRVAADLYCKYEQLKYDAAEYYLRHKPHPALTASGHVREAKESLKAARSENVILKLQLEKILHDYPFIEASLDFEETHEPETHQEELETHRLTEAEFAALNETERNQLALDRWTPRNSWEAGAEYEESVGWEYEENGFHVEYTGVQMGRSDLGIDLICRKDDKTHLVQCKRWKGERLIRENAIAQLYGTAFRHALETGALFMDSIVPVLITTSTLSPVAKKFAALLKVRIKETHEMKPYPKIKCNVGVNGEKIYHLPMDQQYYSLKLTPPDDLKLFTCQEAKSKGFRRAYRWRA
jgi:hypothetical protein